MKVDAMYKFLEKLKKSIKAFKTAWKNNQSPAELKIDSMTSVIDSIHQRQEVINIINDLSEKTAQVHVKMMDEFFFEVARKIMPGYLVDMYIESKKSIPHLEMFIHSFSDLKERETGQDIRINFHGKLVGHSVIKSKMVDSKIQTSIEKIFVANTN